MQGKSTWDTFVTSYEETGGESCLTHWKIFLEALKTCEKWIKVWAGVLPIDF